MKAHRIHCTLVSIEHSFVGSERHEKDKARNLERRQELRVPDLGSSEKNVQQIYKLVAEIDRKQLDYAIAQPQSAPYLPERLKSAYNIELECNSVPSPVVSHNEPPRASGVAPGNPLEGVAFGAPADPATTPGMSSTPGADTATNPMGSTPIGQAAQAAGDVLGALPDKPADTSGLDGVEETLEAKGKKAGNAIGSTVMQAAQRVLQAPADAAVASAGGAAAGTAIPVLGLALSLLGGDAEPDKIEEKGAEWSGQSLQEADQVMAGPEKESPQAGPVSLKKFLGVDENARPRRASAPVEQEQEPEIKMAGPGSA